jgi:hypothetical protein
MIRLNFIICAAALTLFACGKPDAVDSQARNADALPVINTPQASPTGAPPTNVATTPAPPAAAETTPPASAKIPAALQGRWALTPRDCTSPLGDAKGLLVVSGSELRFYESRAIPSADVQTSATSISGNFAFMGEGQSWIKNETFELQQDKLVRTESDPMASFTYARC